MVPSIEINKQAIVPAEEEEIAEQSPRVLMLEKLQAAQEEVTAAAVEEFQTYVADGENVRKEVQNTIQHYFLENKLCSPSESLHSTAHAWNPAPDDNVATVDKPDEEKTVTLLPSEEKPTVKTFGFDEMTQLKADFKHLYEVYKDERDHTAHELEKINKQLRKMTEDPQARTDFGGTGVTVDAETFDAFKTKLDKLSSQMAALVREHQTLKDETMRVVEEQTTELDRRVSTLQTEGGNRRGSIDRGDYKAKIALKAEERKNRELFGQIAEEWTSEIEALKGSSASELAKNLDFVQGNVLHNLWSRTRDAESAASKCVSTLKATFNAMSKLKRQKISKAVVSNFHNHPTEDPFDWIVEYHSQSRAERSVVIVDDPMQHTFSDDQSDEGKIADGILSLQNETVVDPNAPSDILMKFPPEEEEEEVTMKQLQLVTLKCQTDSSRWRSWVHKLKTENTELKEQLMEIGMKVEMMTPGTASSNSSKPAGETGNASPMLFKLRAKVEGTLEPQLAETAKELSQVKIQLQKVLEDAHKLVERVSRKADRDDLETVMIRLNEPSKPKEVDPQLKERLAQLEKGIEEANGNYMELAASANQNQDQIGQMQDVLAPMKDQARAVKDETEALRKEMSVQGFKISKSVQELKKDIEEEMQILKHDMSNKRVSPSDLETIADRVKRMENKIRDNRQMLTAIPTGNSGGSGKGDEGTISERDYIVEVVKRVVLNLEDRFMAIERRIEPLLAGTTSPKPPPPLDSTQSQKESSAETDPNSSTSDGSQSQQRMATKEQVEKLHKSVKVLQNIWDKNFHHIERWRKFMDAYQEQHQSENPELKSSLASTMPSTIASSKAQATPRQPKGEESKERRRSRERSEDSAERNEANSGEKEKFAPPERPSVHIGLPTVVSPAQRSGIVQQSRWLREGLKKPKNWHQETPR
eukprot:gnl/MRDRNA2_/MRDRNA2_98477_c0_seq1.p1 gnl/MRDRNA2_/MRDRNA2_98477_c0~~gnl/MRDRNA2_/MRDRNA2_98477_c0_seq1.p1  ORF type:complete len:1002 (+),score=248.14 gnl/MRDRNA2_/MRDRNA2_98477_c0_seq1:224-3007(+)